MIPVSTRDAHQIMKDLGQGIITSKEAKKRSLQVEISGDEEQKDKLKKWQQTLAEYHEDKTLKKFGSAGAIVLTLRGIHELIMLEAIEYGMKCSMRTKV